MRAYTYALLVAVLPGVAVTLSVSPHAAPSFSADELRSLARGWSTKTPGSTRYLRLWRRWSALCVGHIRHDLSRTLPHPIDPVAKEELDFNLGNGADLGIMPSFSDPGARSGYALNLFCRVSLLADLLVNTGDSLPPVFAEDINHLLCTRAHNTSETTESNTCRLVSIGGACGYDFVSAALVATFHSGGNNAVVKATVFDYEEGWKDLADAMSAATHAALPFNDHSCHFGGKCDITKPMSDASNAGCLQAVKSTDLWTCQYCIAENVLQLRESNFCFFEELFRETKDGALFVFTETTHRVWPELLDVVLALQNDDNDDNDDDDAKESLGKNKGLGFEVAFPRVGGRNKTGRQMVLRKKAGAVINEEHVALCEGFRRDSRKHERRLHKGIVRQKKKVRRTTTAAGGRKFLRL